MIVLRLYSLPMYAALSATTVGCLLGLLIPAVSAREALNVSPETPENYDTVKEELKKIPPELESAQCGGWDDRSVGGTIATVTGVPGRDGVWNGAILTGVATRKDNNNNQNIDDDFLFPNETTGLTTVCSPDKTEIPKKVWRPKQNGLPGEIEQVDIVFPHPQFKDPSCRWRPKRNGGFEELAPDIALKPLNEYDPPPEYGELDQEPQDRQSPPVCENFCRMLNSYQYLDCIQPVTVPAPNPADPLYSTCLRWANRYLCSDQEVKDAVGACNGNTAEMANSRQCIGPQCRCEEDGGPDINGCAENPGIKQDESPVYYSYYRRYEGSYSRDAVTPEDTDDKASDSAQVACYGFYDEFDPKTRRTQAKDRRCVINVDTANRRETQQEKGEYGQKSNLPDRDPKKNENQRKAEPYRDAGDYNSDDDLWYLKLGGGFSLLNEQVFSEFYNNELTNVFLDVGKLDTAKIRATEQLEKSRPFASGSFIRAFDDTGERSVTSWWQSQQTAMAAALHPPVIRMILPSGWAFGMNPDDPFFKQNDVKVLTPAEKYEDRIEVQINAQDDTLGAALGYLQRSLLLHVIEEPVPLIVPVGSAVEFRAKAEAWCAWVMQRDHVQNCDNAPADVQRLMDTLTAYATGIDQYRLLRAELPMYAAKILDIQQGVTKPITDWMIANIDAYQEFLSRQRLLQEGLGREWRSVQEKMETFGSTTNMPWCMNQRFTMPVYSLLDDWLPARSNNGNRSAYGLPVIRMDADADMVIDLSAVAFMSGSIALPVLQPTQVRVTDFPSPPSPEHTLTLDQSYPPLPSIAAIHDALARAADALPPPQNSNAPVIPPIDLKPIDPAVVEALLEAMRKTGHTIDDMNTRYERFWKSIGPFKQDDQDPEFESGNTKGVAHKKPRLECLSWDDSTCQHVEMDLRERFMRIASRPLVFLKEDYESKDEKRGIGGPCIAQSDVCSPLHPEEGGEKHLWEIIGPRTIRQPLNELRIDVRKATLPQPIGDIPGDKYPHYGTSTGNLLPTYNVPRAIDLFPAASSAASSPS